MKLPTNLLNSGLAFGYIGVTLMVFLSACANIVPPEGGKKDTTPPVLLDIDPVDSSLQLKPTKIELRFNKFMELKELNEQLQMSPLLATKPQVQINGKKVIIKLVDSQLLDQTTYRLSLGNALVDNREATPYPNFNYTFTTGSYFDTLEIKGKVIDAATGLPDSAATILLYDAPAPDSVLFRQRPIYAIKADGSGFFHQPFMPNRQFKIFAVGDANNNLLYDPFVERVAFSDSLIQPQESFEQPVLLFTFKEIQKGLPNTTTDTIQATEMDTLADSNTNKLKLADNRSGKKPSLKSAVPYRVVADTTDPAKRTADITQPLQILKFQELHQLNKDKIYLSYDNNGIEIEAITQMQTDSTGIALHTEWQQDRLYTLRLVSGWAKDSTGADLAPGKYFFRTKQVNDYARTTITIDSGYVGNEFILYIFKDADTIYYKPISEATIHLELLAPGEYSMRIIADANGNGYWDTGELLNRKQPEEVFSYMGKMVLKAGWDNETHFVPVSKSKLQNLGLTTSERFGSKNTDEHEANEPQDED